MVHTHLERERAFGAVRVLAQLLLEKEEGQKAWDGYKDLMFPWQEAEDEEEKKKVLEVMAGEVARGPLGVALAPGMEKRSGVPVQRTDVQLPKFRPPSEGVLGRRFRESAEQESPDEG